MESSWGGLPHLTRGDVRHPRACQTGLAVSVQRALVGQVAWKVKGECAHVLPALAAWPRAGFCRVTCSLWMLVAGDGETGLALFVSLPCVAPVAAEGQFQGNTAVFQHAERRQNESRTQCLGSWPCLRGLLTCSTLGPGGLSGEETVVGDSKAEW